MAVANETSACGHTYYSTMHYPILPSFATLAMLSGDVDVLVGKSSVRKRQVSVLKRVKSAPSGVIVV